MFSRAFLSFETAMLRPRRSFPSGTWQDFSRDFPASRYSSQGFSSFHGSAINEMMLPISDDLRCCSRDLLRSSPLYYGDTRIIAQRPPAESQPEYRGRRRKKAQFTFDAAASQSFKGGKKHFWAMARLDCEHKGNKCSRDEWANRFDRINRKKRRKNQMIFTVRDFTFCSAVIDNLASLFQRERCRSNIFYFGKSSAPREEYNSDSE